VTPGNPHKQKRKEENFLARKREKREEEQTRGRREKNSLRTVVKR